VSWLKRDDQRCIHPKIGELTDREYRALDALHEYCARTRNDGCYQLADLRRAVYLTPAGPRSPSRLMNAKWLRLRLVDQLTDDEYQIHDWSEYQPKDPTGAERKRLERERKATQDPDTLTGQSQDTSQDNHGTRHSDVTPSRARVPVPSRPKEQTQGPLLARPDDATEREPTAQDYDIFKTLEPELRNIP
jgi:hypothetical protein